MPGERFTSWLSEEERAGVRELAAELNCSDNMIVRMAVRSLVLGIPVQGYIQTLAKEVRDKHVQAIG